MKYIVIDPCYIMDDADYDKVCETDGWDELFNMKTKHKKTGEVILIHEVLATAHGDGSYENINVDSGLLCVAAKIDDWNEPYGRVYPNLHEAMMGLIQIAKKF